LISSRVCERSSSASSRWRSSRPGCPRSFLGPIKPPRRGHGNALHTRLRAGRIDLNEQDGAGARASLSESPPALRIPHPRVESEVPCQSPKRQIIEPFGDNAPGPSIRFGVSLSRTPRNQSPAMRERDPYALSGLSLGSQQWDHPFHGAAIGAREDERVTTGPDSRLPVLARFSVSSRRNRAESAVAQSWLPGRSPPGMPA